jgi:ribose/xylose/arabinose/galactoside ABC-type transport system permease subunit
MELEVLAAVILGGASLLGGSGTIFKTVIGVLILGFIQNGLLLAGLAVLRPVRRDLDHHHPCGLAGYRHQARKALVADRLRRDGHMQNGTLKNLLKNGAIWAFIVLELIFFEVAGEYLVAVRQAFMDLDNMLLLLKQSAPIGIIAIGMTVVMINGNIDLSVGATYALAGSSCSTA